MNKLERDLCNLIQTEFPLDRHPYAVIAGRLGITEEACIGMLRDLSRRGILRAIQPVLAWSALGFSNVLIGLEVDEERLDTVAREINREPGVTHNYARRGPLNLWCTLTYESDENKASFLNRIGSLPGVKRLREFPACTVYKIGLVLDV